MEDGSRSDPDVGKATNRRSPKQCGPWSAGGPSGPS